jgi:hypothetical protein
LADAATDLQIGGGNAHGVTFTATNEAGAADTAVATSDIDAVAVVTVASIATVAVAGDSSSAAPV